MLFRFGFCVTFLGWVLLLFGCGGWGLGTEFSFQDLGLGEGFRVCGLGLDPESVNVGAEQRAFWLRDKCAWFRVQGLGFRV